MDIMAPPQGKYTDPELLAITTRVIKEFLPSVKSENRKPSEVFSSKFEDVRVATNVLMDIVNAAQTKLMSGLSSGLKPTRSLSCNEVFDANGRKRGLPQVEKRSPRVLAPDSDDDTNDSEPSGFMSDETFLRQFNLTMPKEVQEGGQAKEQKKVEPKAGLPLATNSKSGIINSQPKDMDNGEGAKGDLKKAKEVRKPPQLQMCMVRPQKKLTERYSCRQCDKFQGIVPDAQSTFKKGLCNHCKKYVRARSRSPPKSPQERWRIGFGPTDFNLTQPGELKLNRKVKSKPE